MKSENKPGILLCGLNGTGKSTLGRELASLLGCDFFDNEDYWFPKTDPDNPYADPRPVDEVCELLQSDIEKSAGFVLASVSGNYPEAITAHFTHAIVLEVPREIRLARVRARSFGRFGERMLPGGDLYENEEAFLRMVESRGEDYSKKRTRLDGLTVIHADGRLEPSANARRLAELLKVTSKNSRLSP